LVALGTAAIFGGAFWPKLLAATLAHEIKLSKDAVVTRMVNLLFREPFWIIEGVVPAAG
jgi:hypothetical protein